MKTIITALLIAITTHVSVFKSNGENLIAPNEMEVGDIGKIFDFRNDNGHNQKRMKPLPNAMLMAVSRNQSNPS